MKGWPELADKRVGLQQPSVPFKGLLKSFVLRLAGS